MTQKRIIYLTSLIIFIIIIFLIGIFIFNWFSKPLVIQKINNEIVNFPYYVKSTNSILYLNTKESIWYKYDLNDGQKTKLINDNLFGVVKIDYRENGDNAIVYFNDPDYTIKHYDFKNNNVFLLNQYITNIIWSVEKQKLFYTYYKIPGPYDESSEYLLNINQAEYSGENWNSIKDFTKSNYVDLNLYPSNESNYIYYIPAPYENGGTLKKLYTNTAQDEIMTKENIIFSNVIFSPDKNKIAFINKDKALVVQNLDDKDSEKIIYKEPVSIDRIVWGYDNQSLYILKDINNLIKINTSNSNQTDIKLTSSDVVNGFDYTIKNLGVSQDNKVMFLSYRDRLYKVQIAK